MCDQQAVVWVPAQSSDVLLAQLLLWIPVRAPLHAAEQGLDQGPARTATPAGSASGSSSFLSSHWGGFPSGPDNTEPGSWGRLSCGSGGNGSLRPEPVQRPLTRLTSGRCAPPAPRSRILLLFAFTKSERLRPRNFPDVVILTLLS